MTNESGKEVAANDDFEDKGAGLTTHQADSYILSKLPADGRYLVHLSDSQGKGGSEDRQGRRQAAVHGLLLPA